jgi:CHAD domain-containing protein
MSSDAASNQRADLAQWVKAATSSLHLRMQHAFLHPMHSVCTARLTRRRTCSQVTATAVEHPEVDVAAVRSLALALGCVDFASRSFHTG